MSALFSPSHAHGVIVEICHPHIGAIKGDATWGTNRTDIPIKKSVGLISTQDGHLQPVGRLSQQRQRQKGPHEKNR
jgi:hypothetical protein